VTAVLDAPTLYAPYIGGDPLAALREHRAVIEHAITHQPRSLQTQIGPSEIGNPCDHCLAAKLAGWPEAERGIAWLPTIGTAVHAWIEEAFITSENTRNAVHTGGLRYRTEAQVMVGQIDGQDIWGSTDLLDLTVGMTVDWKIVGPTTLRSAKAGSKPGYRVQADLYAKGWNDAGVRVDHVAIAYLPRNAVSLNDAVWWTAPHDRGRAERALERATGIARNLAALTTLGQGAVNAWISALPRDPDCYDCARFPDGAGISTPGHHAPAPFADLLG
jgi:hypothetical protein